MPRRFRSPFEAQSCAALGMSVGSAEPGLKFGEYTLIEDTGCKAGPIAIWRARCSCGTVKKIPITSLQDGSVKSCGCSRSRIHRRTAEARYTVRLGGALKELLPKRGAIMALAQKLQTSPSRIYDIVSGRTLAVRSETVNWIADAMDITSEQRWALHYAAALDAGFEIDGIPRGIFIHAGEGI